MGAAEGGELRLFAPDDARRHGPTPGAADYLLGKMFDRRHRDSERARAARPKEGERGTERLHQAADLRAPTPGQHDEARRRIIEAAPLAWSWAKHGQAFDQRMAHIGAGRAPEAPMCLGLEGLQRQDVIDVGAHLPGAARPPGPHARTDIIEDRNVGQPAPDASGNGVGEIRAVDDHDRIRAGGHDGVHRAIDALHDRRQLRHHGGDAHDGDVGEREQAAKALRFHGVTAHALEPDRSGAGLQGSHELRAQLIARFLAGDEKELERCARHGRVPADGGRRSTPTRNSP
jgi:hypothetical protein